jgi:RecJ-like exonuclease
MSTVEKNKCPVCKGSGKLVDNIYDWVIINCYACDGTGIEPDWHKKLMEKIKKEEKNVF